MKSKITPPGRKPDVTPTESSTPLPRLLSLEDTADVLGCSLKTLRRMIDAKTLPVVRLGRLLRVHPEDLARLIAGHRGL